MTDRLLVALDGSDASSVALQKAVELAQETQAGLDLLHVIDTRQYSVNMTAAGDVDGHVLYNAEQTAEAQLKDLAKPLQDQGLDVKVHLRFGSPRTVIAYDAPKDYGTTFIVLGRSSKKMVTRMFIGSVASFVVENAPCDVLIVTNPGAKQ